MTTTEQERERLRRLAEEEYRRKLEAIDWVLLHASGNGDLQPTRKTKAAPTSATPSLPVAVKDVVPQIDGDFDRGVLVSLLKATYPGLAEIAPNYLRVILGNMVKGKLLKVTQQGGGKRLTRYRYVGE